MVKLRTFKILWKSGYWMRVKEDVDFRVRVFESMKDAGSIQLRQSAVYFHSKDTGNLYCLSDLDCIILDEDEEKGTGISGR